jgi:hypothetical protein
MIAFEHPHRAVQWCLAVQVSLHKCADTRILCCSGSCSCAPAAMCGCSHPNWPM